MLTREAIARVIGGAVPEYEIDEVLSIMEAHIAELLKDRYQMGESVQVCLRDDQWTDGTVTACRDVTPLKTWTDNPTHVRHLPQGRPLTHTELEFDVITHFGITTDEARALPEAVLVAMLKKIGAPTTVEGMK